MSAIATASARAPRAGVRAGEAFFDPASFRAEDGALWLLRRALVAVIQLVGEATDLGTSTVPLWALFHVYSGRADTVADLARKCTVDAGTMTRVLDKLARRGLCRRVRSQVDRRVVHIELTPEGIAAAKQMPRVLSRIYNAVLAGFTPHEWEQLKTLLERLADSAEALAGQGVGMEMTLS